MTLGRNAVGYLTESMHGAGSPQAQRIQIARQMQLDFKKALALELAGVDTDKKSRLVDDISEYFSRVFSVPTDEEQNK
jgi:4-hydroxybutyryl-CoA dehydratase/vinylacetyl-CoA-Delta-isomerase